MSQSISLFQQQQTSLWLPPSQGSSGYAVDFSSYQTDPGQVTLDKLRCLRDTLGCRRIVVRLSLTDDWSNLDPTVRQALLWAEQLKLEICVYYPPYWGQGGLTMVDRLYQYSKEFSILDHYLDVEFDGFTPLPTPDQWPYYIDVIDRMRAILPTGKRGIYTSYYYWHLFTGNTDIFRNEKLFNALWHKLVSGRPDIVLDFKRMSYGGWSAPKMEQFSGTVMLECGFESDLDYYDDAAA